MYTHTNPQTSQPQTVYTAYGALATQYTPNIDAAADFIFQIHQHDHGDLAVGFFRNSPDKHDAGHTPIEWRWFTLDGTGMAYNQARDKIEYLIASFGDVYISRSLFPSSKRQNDTALPSRILWVDDAPKALIDDLKPSMVLNTGINSYQAIWLLNRPLDARTIESIQAQMVARYGADDCIAANHVIRIPGSYNTKSKHGGCYPVTLSAASGTVYSADDFVAMYPPIPKRNNTTADIAIYSGNIDALINPKTGLPKKLDKTARRQEWIKSLFLEPESYTDTSVRRWSIAKTLVLHGYNDAVINALLLHYTYVDHKPERWLYEDCQRCIDELRNPTRPGREPVTPKNGIDDNVNLGAMVKAPKSIMAQPAPNRPKSLTADELMEWYESQADSSVVMLTVQDVSQRVHVSESTIRRLERTLKQDGKIERVQSGKHSSILKISRAVKSINQPQFKGCQNTLENASDTPNATASQADTDENNSLLYIYISSNTSIKEHRGAALAHGVSSHSTAPMVPPCVLNQPSDTEPSTIETIAHCLSEPTPAQPFANDCANAIYAFLSNSYERVDYSTGEIKNMNKTVARCIEALGGQFDERDIRARYKAVRKRWKIDTSPFMQTYITASKLSDAELIDCYVNKRTVNTLHVDDDDINVYRSQRKALLKVINERKLDLPTKPKAPKKAKKAQPQQAAPTPAETLQRPLLESEPTAPTNPTSADDTGGIRMVWASRYYAQKRAQGAIA